MFLYFKIFNNSKKLNIMNFILSFNKNYFLKKRVVRYYWSKLNLVKILDIVKFLKLIIFNLSKII